MRHLERDAMKIAVIHPKFSSYGGLERMIADIVQAYVARGHEVTIICRSWHGEVEKSVNIVELKARYVDAVTREWSFARAVQKYLEQHHFDWVVSDQKILGVQIYIAGGGAHIAYYYSRLQRSSFLEKMAITLRPYNLYTLWMERRFFASSTLSKVICVSNAVKADISRHYRVADGKLKVVYNGIDCGKYNEGREDDCSKYENLLPTVQYRLIFVGSGYERKGLLPLLKAVSALPAVGLIVVGKDRNVAKYQRLVKQWGIEQRCKFLGPRTDVPSLYRYCNAFAMPSFYEPFGLVYIEALAAGLPVIISKQAGAAEIITDGEQGYIVNPYDIRDVKSKINMLMGTKFDSAKLREFAKQYNTDKMMDDMLQALLD